MYTQQFYLPNCSGQELQRVSVQITIEMGAKPSLIKPSQD
jgi:hypothetical protein